MSSPTDRIYDPNDPYAPRWVRNPSSDQRRIATPDRAGREIDDTALPQFLIDGLRVPASLHPGNAPDDRWPQPSRLGRLRLLGALAVAGLVAAIVVFLATGRFSPPGTTGAGPPSESRFAGSAARPQDQPGAVLPNEPSRQLALADTKPGLPAADPPLAPTVVAQPAAKPTTAPKIAALAPASPPPSPAISIPAPDQRVPTAPTLDPNSEEVVALVKRGEQLAAAGDMAAARLTLRRAADAHNARAALALGATYDPNVLQNLGIYGIEPDVAQTRRWYERAKEFGSAEAQRRLETLASRNR